LAVYLRCMDNVLSLDPSMSFVFVLLDAWGFVCVIDTYLMLLCHDF